MTRAPDVIADNQWSLSPLEASLMVSPPNPKNIAGEYLIDRKAALLTSWREFVRADERLPVYRLAFTDAELEDHLPDLLDSIAANLRGDEVPEDVIRLPAIRHGSTRRAQGYSILQVIWEFAIFRKLLRESLELLTTQISSEVLYVVRESVLELTDLSEQAGVETYVNEAQRERDTARDELRKANDQKDRFLAVLSHELRNPLASIRTASHILRSNRASNSERQRALEIIERQTRYQTRLIDDLLDLNRISQGRIELKREPIDLRRAIENVVATYLPAVESKSVAFRFDSPGAQIITLADQVRIEQIVANLLTNSLKFTRTGGSIEIVLRRVGEKATISVRDTGAGIEPTKLSQVFELYSQAQAGLSADGLGIGLWLAKQLVELHGGTIEARSDGLGKGTEVTIMLDCIQNLVVENANKRVLLVEDDPDQRELLAAVLHDVDTEVVGARDGAEAVATATSKPFDVCILDLNLPDMSGYDLIAKLLNAHKDRKPLTIALTGYGRPEDTARIKAAGFDVHLVKPVDIEELQKIIAQAENPSQTASRTD